MEKKKNNSCEELEIQDLIDEVRSTNNRNHDNFSKLDGKLSFYFTLTTTILLLFVQFVKFPQHQIFFGVYYLTVFVLILTLIILIIAYNPSAYQTIDTNKLINKYLNRG